MGAPEGGVGWAGVWWWGVGGVGGVCGVRGVWCGSVCGEKGR